MAIQILSIINGHRTLSKGDIELKMQWNAESQVYDIQLTPKELEVTLLAYELSQYHTRSDKNATAIQELKVEMQRIIYREPQR